MAKRVLIFRLTICESFWTVSGYAITTPRPPNWIRSLIAMSARFAYPHSGEEQVNRGATAEDQAGRDYPFPGFILIRESRHIQGSVCDECDVQQHLRIPFLYPIVLSHSALSFWTSLSNSLQQISYSCGIMFIWRSMRSTLLRSFGLNASLLFSNRTDRFT